MSLSGKLEPAYIVGCVGVSDVGGTVLKVETDGLLVDSDGPVLESGTFLEVFDCLWNSQIFF